MAATATQVSQSVVVKEKEWVKLFPKQVTENYTNSVTFIKQLTVVAVSMITYLKNAFPEESYSSETFAGLQLKILNNNKCCDDLAQFVTTALQQAFEAFDKKYIHQLALCFYEKSCEPENLIEYHIFEYSYHPEGVVLNINSKNRNSDSRSMKCSLEKVKSRTTMFIRSLSMYLMQQSHSELPASYDVSLRLYYNEDAPAGYQAPGYSSAAGPDPLAPSLRDAVRLGWVDTPYHALVARSYTRAPPASAEAAPSDNSPVMLETEKIDFQEKHYTCFVRKCHPGLVLKPDLAFGSAGKIILVQEGLVTDSQAGPVQCPCNKQDVEDQVLITCQYCHTRQHAVCSGFLNTAPASHCCVACAGPQRPPSDPRLAELDAKRRECLCIFRRTLALCGGLRSVSGAVLAARLALGARAAARMLRLLASHALLPAAAPHDLEMERNINHIRLKLTNKRFFLDEEDQDSMVDRLVAETSLADDDPLAEVLSPLEQITLHNTSNLGQVISPHKPRPNANEDKTLQQYREALTYDDVSEELPLSGSHNPVKDVEKIGKRKSMKRKTEDDDWIPKLRSGTRTKKIRPM